MYQIYDMSLEDTKKELEWRKCAIEYKLKSTYEVDIQNGMTCIHDNEVTNTTELH